MPEDLDRLGQTEGGKKMWLPKYVTGIGERGERGGRGGGGEGLRLLVVFKGELGFSMFL